MIAKSTSRFTLSQTDTRWFVRCTLRHHHPQGRRISAPDARYLLGLSPREFEGACIFDMGVGVFTT